MYLDIEVWDSCEVWFKYNSIVPVIIIFVWFQG